MKEKFSTVCELVFPAKGAPDGGEGGKKCATELCIERFRVASAYSRTLGIIARRTDFPDSPRFPIPPLTGLISYYLGKKGLSQKLYSVILDNIVRGILWNTEMQEDMIEASRLIDESIAKSIESMVIREFEFGSPASGSDNASTGEKVRVAIARADPFVSRSMLLGRMMDSGDDAGLEKNIDLAIAYTDDGRLSIRRGDDRSLLKKGALQQQLDCSRIAATFREGGGHPGAAGGFLKTNVKEKGEEAAVTEIDSTLQNYFEQLSEHK